MSVTLKVLEISAEENGTYYSLLPPPAASGLTVSWQTLDSQKSGRDNNIGAMFRDKVADKLPVEISVPYGLTSADFVSIHHIIREGYFWCKLPDPTTGTYHPIKVYCAGCKPPIAKITEFNSSGEPSAWIYDAFELSFVEM
ncbi:MAG: hypothetical protein IKD72_09210 [Clostridia bacterium]|nr:hypothetical protein [Clostridia bacterium]